MMMVVIVVMVVVVRRVPPVRLGHCPSFPSSAPSPASISGDAVDAHPSSDGKVKDNSLAAGAADGLRGGMAAEGAYIDRDQGATPRLLPLEPGKTCGPSANSGEFR
jgi:hypothetical protein